MLLDILHDLHFCLNLCKQKLQVKTFFWAMTYIKYDFLDFLSLCKCARIKGKQDQNILQIKVRQICK